jgi:hypothetical protein
VGKSPSGLFGLFYQRLEWRGQNGGRGISSIVFDQDLSLQGPCLCLASIASLPGERYIVQGKGFSIQLHYTHYKRFPAQCPAQLWYTLLLPIACLSFSSSSVV